MKASIDGVVLQSYDAARSRRFAGAHLRSVIEPGEGPGSATVSYLPASAPAERQAGRANGGLSTFWKFSVFTSDLDRLRAELIDGGTEVSEAVQFGDIGYLCHLREPGGIEIELLQRTFRDTPAVPGLGDRADELGLITLRVGDLDASQRFYDTLGMTLLATMEVDDGRPDPFDLYFYAYTDDAPPDLDPAGVANREWLYQRPFTIIELQAYRGDQPLDPTDGGGLVQIDLVIDDVDRLTGRLTAEGVAWRGEGDRLRFASPDGHEFTCRRADAAGHD